MIELKQGDILRANAEALVNTVNCVGVMGRGIALQFKKVFPENFKHYKVTCDKQELQPGKMLFHDLNRLQNPRYVVNFPTKRHWKGKSRQEDIEAGLRALVQEIRARQIHSIAIPPLGCGLGGLRWADVRAKIEEAFRDLPDVQVLLYEPKGAPPAEKMAHSPKSPVMTVGRAALLVLMRRYLAAVMDPFVTLLEIHKLMYFMQETGEKLKLQYNKAPYGPYAQNLRHVLTLMEGHHITGYGDGQDNPDRQINLLPEVLPQAESFLQDHPATRKNFERVVDLISGFETPFGMELLSTVHWTAVHEGAATADQAIAKTYDWNSRKRMFQEKHIRIAWDILERKGWLQHPQPA
ncbi:MAG: Appr-1-p processing protein [Deltaproteobacteria bacterium CG23_combo_of_CG06-09_8_20_14_all_60_8]|nr:MAG: Appr-1-p processing protein [Desulfobacterales bacterium CG2_30_60_27]PIP42848.1 MAG: Appr-1-p processing protein [Deltaproteobacteria bacterium CG23_combo_of_CG06-09_8_20_14_all_60_8]